MVGLIPLFAVETLESEVCRRAAGLQAAARVVHREPAGPDGNVACMRSPGEGERRLLSIVGRGATPPGAAVDAGRERSSSRPTAFARFRASTRTIHMFFRVTASSIASPMSPAESSTGLFGGNSNWRGPIWFPVNFLLIESLQKFHHYFGDDFKVECPTGSGRMHDALGGRRRIVAPADAYLPARRSGRRPVHGRNDVYQHDPHWRDLVLFYEYFHGDNGSGVGASHQTGWTGLVAKLLQQSGE